MNGPKLEVVTVESEEDKQSLLKHDETDLNWATLLANLEPHIDPQAMGVIRKVQGPVYDRDMESQLSAGKGTASVQELLQSGQTWSVD